MLSPKKLLEIFLSLLFPWHFMLISLSYLPATLSQLYRTSGPRALLPWHRVQRAWFSRFWSFAGPRIREGNGPRITALLEGRVSRGRAVDHAPNKPVSGVVLDIGPGLGYWVDLYGKTAVPLAGRAAEGGNQSAIEKVYGVEPGLESHPGLRRRAKEAGLEGVYEILPVGIEDISKVSVDGATFVEKGSVDCIVSLLCLCSIPEPEKNVKELYGYLKEGGRWYVFEHVVVDEANWPMRAYQALVNLFWPHMLGGCQLRRNTRKSIEQAGPWTKIDVAQPPEEQWYATVPHVFGTFTK